MPRKLYMNKEGVFLLLDKVEERVIKACEDNVGSNIPIRKRISDVFLDAKERLSKWEEKEEGEV